MVQGIAKFKEYFAEYVGQYVFIGGTACDIILGRLGEDFRTTKDFAIVLLIEALSEDFVKTFIRFIEAGGYTHINKGSGDNQFYRFEKPKDSKFPHMIELFSKTPDYLQSIDASLAPIHVNDEVISLSAILLNDEYYTLLQEGVILIDDVAVLDLEYIILFKIKAWLDLSQRKAAGESIDTKSIKKHKNDVFRLVANIDIDSSINITRQIKEDIKQFIINIAEESIDFKNLGIKNVTKQELIDIIEKCYNLSEVFTGLK